jgi:hypothetical protein
MITIQTIHSFVKDPLTDKLFHKYVSDPKAQRVFDTSVRLIELAVVAAPLIITAVRGVRDIANGKTTLRRSGLRRLVPA